MIKIYKKIRHSFPILFAYFIEKRSQRYFYKKNPELWEVVNDYIKKTKSTGCSFSDYFVLYNHIRRRKPQYILECGTGVSTLVMAHALQENEADEGRVGKIISMEENEYYYVQANKIMPDKYKRTIEIVLSPAVEKTYDFLRGSGYENIPKYEYDFVFVDGPNLMTDPSKRPLVFNFDLIEVVQSSQKPVSAFVDTRTTTAFVYNLIFGNKFRYDYLRKIGIIEPSTKDDMLTGKQIVVRSMNKHEFKRPRFLSLLSGIY